MCSVNGCTKPTKSRGLCSGHYKRWQRNQPLEPPFLKQTSQVGRMCEAVGCDKIAATCGLCDGHYRRFQRGQPVDGPLAVSTTQRGRICEVEGCRNPSHIKGLCQFHWQRKHRTGTTDDPEVMRATSKWDRCAQRMNTKIRHDLKRHELDQWSSWAKKKTGNRSFGANAKPLGWIPLKRKNRGYATWTDGSLGQMKRLCVVNSKHNTDRWTRWAWKRTASDRVKRRPQKGHVSISASVDRGPAVQMRFDWATAGA